jgi:hypothetical protein
MFPAAEWLIIASCCALIFAYVVHRRYKKGKVRGDLFFWSILAPTYVWFGILAWAGKYGYWSDRIIQMLNWFLNGVIRAIGLRLTQVFVALIVMVLGFGAHHFKKRNQVWYGNVEILVGLLTAWVVAGTLKPGNLELSKWVTLAGSAYVIGRGIGNHAEGNNRLSATRAA